MIDGNTYSVIGIYLTLAGLLGTFFFVHLSNWLQDLLKLKAKWELNKLGTDESQKAAIRECRFEIKGLFNHIPILATIIISIFIYFLSMDSYDLLGQAPKDNLAIRLKSMLDIFLTSYFVLTGYLIIHGVFLGFKIRSGLKNK